MLLPIARKVAKLGRKVGKSSEFTWRYILNFEPTVSYACSCGKLCNEATRVLDCLNSDGVAITSTHEFLGPESCYDDLVHAVEQLEIEKAPDLAVARGAIASADQTATRKKYMISLLSDSRRLDRADVYTRFALQHRIRQVVNAYYGMYVHLRFCNVWHNFVTQAPPCESQLWHRDPEDRFVVKVFVNMCDVDAGTGPFNYAAGSHPKGNCSKTPAYLYKDGETPRSSDEQMAEIVPRNRWITGIGPKGTMIFADTRGYHKGGLARQRDRIVYMCEFFSNGADPGYGISTALGS